MSHTDDASSGAPGQPGEHTATFESTADATDSTGAADPVGTRPPPEEPGAHAADPGVGRPPGGLVALVTLATALLFTGTVLAIAYRDVDDQPTTLLTVLAGAASVVLLGFCLLGAVSARNRPGRPADPMGVVPGAWGVVGAGLAVGAAFDFDDTSAWVVGGVVTALGAVLFVITRGGALALTTVLGLALLASRTAGEVLSSGQQEDTVVLGGVVLGFVLVVTAVAWFLPTARLVVGVSLGAAAIATYAGLLVSLVFVQLLAGALGGIPAGADESSAPTKDVYVVLAYAGVLVLVWLLLGALSDHTGFRVLAVVAPTVLVPLATVVLQVDEPGWWALAAAVLGLLLGLASLLLHRRRT